MKPISKKVLGNVAGSYKFNAFFPGDVAPVDAFGIKMIGSHSFLVAKISNPAITARCTLVNAVPTVPGTVQLVVSPFGSAAENARKIMSHLVETFADRAYTITHPATIAGQADIIRI